MVLSEFQLSLIGAGAITVTAVWVYNIWQEYRYRKVAQRIFGEQQTDVLVEDDIAEMPSATDLEPSLEAENQPQEPGLVRGGGGRIEPVIHPREEIADASATVVEASVVTPASPVTTPDEKVLDPMIEFGLALPGTPSVTEILAVWRDSKLDFRKRIRWLAQDGQAGQWIELAPNGDVMRPANYVSIQLADRQGAIGRGELESFCKTIEFAGGKRQELAGIASLDGVLAQAQALDDICAAVDIQIAIHIVSRTGREFPGTKLKGLLEAGGLQLATDGLFYLLDADGQRLISVSNSGAVPFDIEQMKTGTTPDVTFWLDVPRVADGGLVFDTMVATARQLAAALDGVLVDDQHVPLADDVLSSIRAKVVELQTQMSTHGLPAGGRRALRLFA
jgi:hypothetical protein